MTTWRKSLAVLVAVVCACVTFAAPALAGPGTYLLGPGERLEVGQSLVTANGISLVMQGDGNLVEYAPGNRPVWASGTNRSGSILVMQGDGNAVIIAPGNVPVWSTGTNGNTNATLELQTDGNLVVYAQGHVARWANGVYIGTGSNGAREQANAILANSAIVLQTVHVSGVVDNAHARQNIADTANGGQAARSSYGGAPGGRVSLDPRMLTALRQLGAEGDLRVSEIAGGSHSAGSRHYAGRAFDVDRYGTRSAATIVTRCRQMGASLALDEGTHVHCEWT